MTGTSSPDQGEPPSNDNTQYFPGLKLHHEMQLSYQRDDISFELLKKGKESI